MIDALATALIAAALIVAGLALIPMVLDRPVGRWQLGGLALVELGLLTQLVTGVINLVGTDRDVAAVTFVAYLVASVLVLPIAAAWALAERSRWGSGVVVVGCLVIAVLIVRLNQIWAGP